MTPLSALLVFGWGNRSRGDDALGPLFVDRLQALIRAGAGGADLVAFVEDYQLQPEHAIDLRGRRHVLFVDASLSCEAPWELQPLLTPQRDRTFTTHALSPEALLQVFREVFDLEPPQCSLLAIRGEHFELGAVPSPAALRHLESALECGRRWVDARAAAAPAHLP